MTGNGEVFSAGGDLRRVSPPPSTPGRPRSGTLASHGSGCWVLLPPSPSPSSHVSPGQRWPGGAVPVASCDFAYASDAAVFATPEIKIGLFALLILPMLIRRIGERNALELVLTGEPIDAHEARRMGLVNAVYPRDNLDASVEALAAKLAKIHPSTMSRSKHAFRTIAAAKFSEGMEIARGIRGAFMGSDELKEAVGRFSRKDDLHELRQSRRRPAPTQREGASGRFGSRQGEAHSSEQVSCSRATRTLL